MIGNFSSISEILKLATWLTTAAGLMLSAEAQEMRGPVEVVDGDTLKMDRKLIHLFGVDAPEIEQQCRIYRIAWPCGKRSVIILSRLIAEKPVRCDVIGAKKIAKDDLLQAHCYNYENVNLNSAIIGAGMAVPILKQTRRYVTAGYSAQIQRLGLWSGRFIPPALWRKGKRFRPIGKPFTSKALKN